MRWLLEETKIERGIMLAVWLLWVGESADSQPMKYLGWIIMTATLVGSLVTNLKRGPS
jgi:hypothetical protein